MERNRRHFGQAHGTPFTIAPLADLINWQADTDTAELILKGEYTNDELDDVTQLLLQHCEATTKLDSISLQLTLDEFIGKIRVWRENTSTSPSGRHLDDKDYSELTLTAQLNVDADEAAGAFHWSHAPTLQETVPLLSTTKAQFNIGSTTITGHYKHHVRQAASRQDFFDKCQAIHHWDEPTFKTVNLALFRTPQTRWGHFGHARCVRISHTSVPR